jgi:TPR repeat protein
MSAPFLCASRLNWRALAGPLSVAVCLGLAPLIPAWAQASSGACGLPASNSDSDLSVAYQAEQPAGPVSCSYGYLAAKCGDFVTANKIFDKCIAKGFVGAMLWKGLMYEDGTGVPQDAVKATAMFKRAADSGHEHYAALGKLHYASALHEGHGIERNEAEARKWFEAAAAEGSDDAREFLETGHHTGSRNQRGEGVGVPTDAVKGQALLKQEPLALPAFDHWHSLGLGLVLAALLAAGAWRQGRQRNLQEPLL